jgi:hypothetical protein
MIATNALKHSGSAASCATPEGDRYFIVAKDAPTLEVIMKQLGFKEVKTETLFPAELLALPHPQPVVTPAAKPTKAATAAKKKGRK